MFLNENQETDNLYIQFEKTDNLYIWSEGNYDMRWFPQANSILYLTTNFALETYPISWPINLSWQSSGLYSILHRIFIVLPIGNSFSTSAISEGMLTFSNDSGVLSQQEQVTGPLQKAGSFELN